VLLQKKTENMFPQLKTNRKRVPAQHIAFTTYEKKDRTHICSPNVWLFNSFCFSLRSIRMTLHFLLVHTCDMTQSYVWLFTSCYSLRSDRTGGGEGRGWSQTNFVELWSVSRPRLAEMAIEIWVMCQLTEKLFETSSVRWNLQVRIFVQILADTSIWEHLKSENGKRPALSRKRTDILNIWP